MKKYPGRGLGGRIDSRKCPPEKWGRERGEMEREREKQRGKKRCEKNPLLLMQ